MALFGSIHSSFHLPMFPIFRSEWDLNPFSKTIPTFITRKYPKIVNHPESGQISRHLSPKTLLDSSTPRSFEMPDLKV